ncbi:MAG: hypothetical protein M1142_00655 [Patescibacteria group bacterium]|nr:hypothetical protein [Patescibacteria group bacterium]
MTIEFYPKGLEQELTLQRARTRLSRREGYAFVKEEGKVIWFHEGTVLEVSGAARQYSQENPNLKVVVVENGGCEGVISYLQETQSLT